MAEESNPGPSEPPQHLHPHPSDGSLGESQMRQSVPDKSGASMHPFMLTGMFPSQNLDDHGPGIYAITCNPSMSPMVGFPPSTLIPLRYKIPTTPDSTTGANEENGQEVRQQQGQQQGPQRAVVVRRFHFAFQIDLGLMLKLAAVVFLLSQDGSKHKLILLMLCASLIYLYRTGVLAPLIRWLQQAGAPPPQPRQLAQPQNGPVDPVDANIPQPGIGGRVEQNNGVERQNPEEQERPAANENRAEPEGGRGFNWWLIVKEIQVFVIGFLTSLIPGLQNN